MTVQLYRTSAQNAYLTCPAQAATPRLRCPLSSPLTSNQRAHVPPHALTTVCNSPLERLRAPSGQTAWPDSLVTRMAELPVPVGASLQGCTWAAVDLLSHRVSPFADELSVVHWRNDGSLRHDVYYGLFVRTKEPCKCVAS